MFDGVARRYDIVNDILSLGRTKAWRKAATKVIAPAAGMKILDMAAGTGSSSAPLAAAGADVIAADFSEGMIAAGKKDPDKYNYGTSGVGGTGQLMMIEVEQATGAKYTHVPYKGGAEWMQALMGGEIQFVADAAQWAPFVDDGKCRVLAFATEKRIPRYPDVPTMIELGVNVVGQSPYGLLGPKGMPPAIVDSLYQAFKQASTEPKVLEYLAKFIQVPWDKNPAEFRAFAEKYYAEVKPLLIKAGLAKP